MSKNRNDNTNIVVLQQDQGGGSFLAFVMLGLAAWFIWTHIWLVLAVAGAAAAGWWWLRTQREKRELLARAEQQNTWVNQGDVRGTYGEREQA